ncbi:energy transducer TonB [Desertivirga brevis]|uniref:energy transducer TonB n=1 Tax=Desertivirga brevis TaxID=2810310 RepID=UPI001A9714DC|nr:hypothetical protein [Pedobacter sp. SYSU D00873]
MNKITYGIIEQYLQGKLDEKKMHELERQALNDPFLADALEGYSKTDASIGPNLSLLQKQLEERIAVQQEQKNSFHFGWQRISVAAAACLLFISASILFWMKGSWNQNELGGKERKVDVSLMDPDSVQQYTSKNHQKMIHNQVPASPVGGWESFEKYLRENRRLVSNPGEGREVILAFKVTATGRPADIRIIKGIDEGVNKEAIRLVSEGPAWEYFGKQEIRLKIDLRKK